MSKGKTTTTQATDPQQMAMFQDLYGKAKGIAQQPFVPYTGARVAGFNPDQLQTFDATRNMFGQSMQFDPRQGLNTLANQSAPTVSPVTGSATDINRGDIRDIRPQSLLSTDLNAYQNPFQSQVIDNTLGDLNRARQMQIQSDQDAAIGRGAFGGSRSALLEAETNRNFADRAGNIAADLRSRGFDRATDLAGQDIGRDFSAQQTMADQDRQVAMANAGYGNQFGLANLDAQNIAARMQPGLDMQNRRFQSGLLSDQLSDQYRNLGLLSGIGGQQQGLQQRGMDAGYGEFMRALNYGPQQLSLLAQGVSALPGDKSVTEGYKPGTMEQIGNAAGTIGTIMGLFSDERLKDNITLVGKSKGHNVYTWTWNDVAKKLGINTPEIGVIAQEVAHIPNAVSKHESGYLTVNYGAL